MIDENCLDKEILKQAINYILFLVSKKEYASFDIKQKLNKKYPQDISEYALSYSIKHNYISDERYANMFVHFRAGSYYGPVKIKYELQLKRISENIIDNAMEQNEIDFDETLKEYFQKKFGKSNLSDYKEKNKVFRHLVSRGFESSSIKKCIFESLSDSEY